LLRLSPPYWPHLGHLPPK